MNEKRAQGVTTGAAEAEGGTDGAPPPPTTETRATAGDGVAPYAAIGEVFAAWFNDRVRRLANPTVMLGTKRAHIVALLPDGRLQCEVETEALQPERQFVAFEAAYLDQLVAKLAAQGA